MSAYSLSSRIFYYLLGNISLEYRSTTKAIQLLAVVKCSVLKYYGIDKVLEPFMDDIHQLEQVSFIIHRRQTHAHTHAHKN